MKKTKRANNCIYLTDDLYKFNTLEEALKHSKDNEECTKITKKELYNFGDRALKESVVWVRESKPLTERKWDYVLKSGVALRRAIQDEDIEGIRQGLIDCYNELFENDLIDEYERDEWVEEVEDADFAGEYNDDDFYGDYDEDLVDYELDQLYDLCDNINVFVALDEALEKGDTEEAEKLEKEQDDLYDEAEYCDDHNNPSRAVSLRNQANELQKKINEEHIEYSGPENPEGDEEDEFDSDFSIGKKILRTIEKKIKANPNLELISMDENEYYDLVNQYGLEDKKHDLFIEISVYKNWTKDGYDCYRVECSAYEGQEADDGAEVYICDTSRKSIKELEDTLHYYLDNFDDLDEKCNKKGKKSIKESQTQELERIDRSLEKRYGKEIFDYMKEYLNLPENKKKVWKYGYEIVPDDVVAKEYKDRRDVYDDACKKYGKEFKSRFKTYDDWIDAGGFLDHKTDRSKYVRRTENVGYPELYYVMGEWDKFLDWVKKTKGENALKFDESCSKKQHRRKLKEATYNPETHKVEPDLAFGCPDVEFFWNGPVSDPEIGYKGNVYNYYDVEEYLWSSFKDDVDSGNYKVSKKQRKDEYAMLDAFDKWCEEHRDYVYGALEDLDPIDTYYYEDDIDESKSLKESKNELYDGKEYEYEGLSFGLLYLDAVGDEKKEYAVMCFDVYDPYDNESYFLDTVDYNGTDEDVMKVIKDNIDEVKSMLNESKKSKKKKDKVRFVGDMNKEISFFNRAMGNNATADGGVGSVAVAESVETKDPTKLFEGLLDLIEFTLVKNEDGTYSLRDNQGANLGGIEEDEFEDARDVIGRLDIYINDYFLDPMREEVLDLCDEYGIEDEKNIDVPYSCDEWVEFKNCDEWLPKFIEQEERDAKPNKTKVRKFAKEIEKFCKEYDWDLDVLELISGKGIDNVDLDKVAITE